MQISRINCHLRFIRMGRFCLRSLSYSLRERLVHKRKRLARFRLMFLKWSFKMPRLCNHFRHLRTLLWLAKESHLISIAKDHNSARRVKGSRILNSILSSICRGMPSWSENMIIKSHPLKRMMPSYSCQKMRKF